VLVWGADERLESVEATPELRSLVIQGP